MLIGKTKSFSADEQIINEGDKATIAYLINKGRVSVRKRTPDGQDIMLATLGPGQMFGEMCLFDNKPRSASVYAITDVEVSIIEKEEFDLFLAYTTPEVKIMFDLLIKRLRDTSNLVAIMKLENKTDSSQATQIESELNNLDFPT